MRRGDAVSAGHRAAVWSRGLAASWSLQVASSPSRSVTKRRMSRTLQDGSTSSGRSTHQAIRLFRSCGDLVALSVSRSISGVCRNDLLVLRIWLPSITVGSLPRLAIQSMTVSGSASAPDGEQPPWRCGPARGGVDHVPPPMWRPGFGSFSCHLATASNETRSARSVIAALLENPGRICHLAPEPQNPCSDTIPSFHAL
jgi:hypothetical protein